MVKINQNIQNTPSTLLIKQIASQISSLLSTGAPIINLSQGTPNLPLFDSAYDAALQCLESRVLPYTDVAGDVSVRTSCADFVNKVVLEKEENEEDCMYKEDHVCLTNGAVGAIYNVLSIQVSSSDDIVVAPLPSYGLYKSDTTLLGGTFIPLECGDPSTGFAISAKDIQKAFDTYQEKLRVLILCYPNNPTGSCFSEQATMDIVAELEKQYIKYPNSFSILLDEVYTGIAAQHFSVLKYASPALRNIMFMVLSISKGLGGAPGARGGFVACMDANVMQHVIKVQMATGANISILSQQLLRGSLQYILSDTRNILQKVQGHYKERVDYVCNRLEEMGRKFGRNEKYFCPKRSEGTFYVVGQFTCGGYFTSDLEVMVAFRDAYKTARRKKKEVATLDSTNERGGTIGSSSSDGDGDDHEEQQEMIASHGVAVIPLSAFSMDEKLCLVRICCAVDMDVLSTAMDVIESMVKNAMM